MCIPSARNAPSGNRQRSLKYITKSQTGLQLVPDRKSLPPDLHIEFAAADDPFVHTTPGPARPGRSAPEPRRRRAFNTVNGDGRSGYQRFLNTPLRARVCGRPRQSRHGRLVVQDRQQCGSGCAEGLPWPGAAPCYLYAVDDRVVWDPKAADRIPQPASSENVDPRLNQVAEVPFLNSDGRTGYERFLNITVRPRAFVIGPNGTGGAAWSLPQRRQCLGRTPALAYCAVLTHGRPCYMCMHSMIAWSGTWRMRPSRPVHAPTNPRQREYAQPSTCQRLCQHQRPECRATALQDQLMTYRAFLEKPAPRAFVITQEGFGRYWLGTSSMEDANAELLRAPE